MKRPARKLVLVGVLLLCATVYFYDRLVVQRQRDRIEAELIELADDMAVTFDESEIAALIGGVPETLSESNFQKTVRYRWRFLPWRPHDLYVQYRKMRGRSILSEVSRTELEPFRPLIERIQDESVAESGSPR